MMEKLKTVELFDDLIQCYDTLLQNSCEREFLLYIEIETSRSSKYQELAQECKRLKTSLDNANQTITTLERRLTSARNLIDLERHQKKKVGLERDAFANLLDDIRRFIEQNSRLNVPPETKQKLTAIGQSIEDLNRDACNRTNMNSIDELSSGSSSVSISFMDADLNESALFSRKKHSCHREETVSPKRKKSNSLTFSPTAPRAEPPESLESEVTGSEVENIEIDNPRMSILERLNHRAHNFVTKTLLKSDHCLPCEKPLTGFGHKALKCLECKAVIHMECRDKLPLPCMRMGTPLKQGTVGSINDYAGLTVPKIPAIIIHCVNEIEHRGLNETGIYRVSGMESQVRELKEKFLKCRGVPNLAEQDIHVICGCLKDFLRNLQDTLIPRAARFRFAEAINCEDKVNRLKSLIHKLPRANLDTLAYLILHLKKISKSSECKMSISNLATVFGPTIVGYSGDDQESAVMGIAISNTIMKELLALPRRFWNDIITDHSKEQFHPPVSHDVSPCEILMKKPRRILNTPKIKKKFFEPLSSNKEN